MIDYLNHCSLLTKEYHSTNPLTVVVVVVVAGTDTFVLGGANKSENEAYTPDNSGTSENSDNTVIFLPYKDETDHSRESSHLSAKSCDKSIGELQITVYSTFPISMSSLCTPFL